MDERLYDSRPNVIDRWRKCPAPKEPNRPVPMVSKFFTPPSEDPYYVNKWKKFREENATGEWFERERVCRGVVEDRNVEAASDRSDVLRPANGDPGGHRAKKPHRKTATRKPDGA